MAEDPFKQLAALSAKKKDVKPAAPKPAGKPVAKEEPLTGADEATKVAPDVTKELAAAEKAVAEEAPAPEEPLVESLDEPEELVEDDPEEAAVAEFAELEVDLDEDLDAAEPEELEPADELVEDEEPIPEPPPAFEEDLDGEPEAEPVAEPAMDESAMRAILKDMFGDTIAKMEAKVNLVASAVFGATEQDELEAVVDENLEGSLLGVVTDMNDEAVKLEDLGVVWEARLVDESLPADAEDNVYYEAVPITDEEGDVVGGDVLAAMPIGASVDMGGEVSAVAADLEELKTTLFGEGAVRVKTLGLFQAEVDDGEGGTVTVQHPVIVVMTNEVVVKEKLNQRLQPMEGQLAALEPLEKRAGSLSDDHDYVTASSLVAELYRPGDFDQAAVAKVISERGETSKEVMEALATDEALMTESAAKARGYSTEALKEEPDMAEEKAKIERDVPALMKRAEWCVENWDSLTGVSREDGGDE